MPEGTEANASTQDGNDNASGDTSAAADTFKPVASQDDLNRIIADRVGRERSKFADYKDLQAKASKFDELEEANKSEIEKANGRVTTAEAERDAAKAEATRLRVAVAKGISLEDADLFLTGTDEETLTKQAERLTQRTSDRKKNGNVVPKEGATTSATPDDERAAARALFGGN